MSRHSVIETISVGFTVDYFPANSVIDSHNPHLTGTVTQIYDSSFLDLYDAHLAIGTDVITYGGFICYPSSEASWSKEFQFIATNAIFPNPMYNFVVGALKNGTRDEVRCQSAKFKMILRDIGL